MRYADGIVFVAGADWLVVLDSSTNRAVAFNRLGKFVGVSALDIVLTSNSRRPGYANGQLFAFDSARNGWQGFRIVDVHCLTAADCDDYNLCTDDLCGASLQCENTDNAVPCNDGDACSAGDTCSAGVCAGSLAGFDGLACLLRRLKAPGVCPDAVPSKLTRLIQKQTAKGQVLADRAEAQGAGSFLSKARAVLEAIGARRGRLSGPRRPIREPPSIPKLRPPAAVYPHASRRASGRCTYNDSRSLSNRNCQPSSRPGKEPRPGNGRGTFARVVGTFKGRVSCVGVERRRTVSATASA